MQKNRRISSEVGMLALGQLLANIFRVGDIVALTGDLGAGKTTLARGIIQALCGDIEVPSPTYTIVQTYDAPEFELWHCDLYRLEKPDDIYELGLLDAMEETVCLIEWPDRMGALLPAESLAVNIGFDGEGRLVSFDGNNSWEDRMKNV